MCTRAVSALAKLLELKGIPTTAIGLVRLHMEKIRRRAGYGHRSSSAGRSASPVTRNSSAVF